MRLHSLVAILVAAAIAAPAQANEPGASQTIASIGSMVLLVPFALAFHSGAKAKEGSATLVNASKRWRVGAVRPDGDKTAVQLDSDDGQLTLDMTIQTRIVQNEGVKVGDPVNIEAIGRAGYIVEKGQGTLALLAEPGAGMIHSTPRN
jgi:hypothetical protein